MVLFTFLLFDFKDVKHPGLHELGFKNNEEFRQTIYDLLRTIKDPEKPSTLEVKFSYQFLMNRD